MNLERTWSVVEVKATRQFALREGRAARQMNNATAPGKYFMNIEGYVSNIRVETTRAGSEVAVDSCFGGSRASLMASQTNLISVSVSRVWNGSARHSSAAWSVYGKRWNIVRLALLKEGLLVNRREVDLRRDALVTKHFAHVVAQRFAETASETEQHKRTSCASLSDHCPATAAAAGRRAPGNSGAPRSARAARISSMRSSCARPSAAWSSLRR